MRGAPALACPVQFRSGMNRSMSLADLSFSARAASPAPATRTIARSWATWIGVGLLAAGGLVAGGYVLVIFAAVLSVVIGVPATALAGGFGVSAAVLAVIFGLRGLRDASTSSPGRWSARS